MDQKGFLVRFARPIFLFLLLIFTFLISFSFVSANILYSQLDDSVQLVGNNLSGNNHIFKDATGHVKEIRISYNDKGNGSDHFIGVGIVDNDTGITYYAYNTAVSSSCGNSFQSTGLNEKQILTFDSNWEWRAYPCNGSNLTFNPTHHYYLISFRNSGGINTQVYYGSSSNPNDFYAYIDSSTSFHDTEKSITSFSFPGVATGVISDVDHTISLHVPFGTDVSATTSDITISDGASLSPNIGVAQNFNNGVTYTVTAVDGSTQNYLVKIFYDCGTGCKSTVLYSQPDNSVETGYGSVATPVIISNASGNISNLKFAYIDHSVNLGLFMGVEIIDFTTSEGYYTSLDGVCGDSYGTTTLNTKIVVNLDSSTTYRKYPCTGPNLVLDPTHEYGINIFRNHGGQGLQKLYGGSDAISDVYLEVTADSPVAGCVADCFSNVLFIPGLEASRLYEQKTIFGIPVEDQLWEPNTNSDVQTLYLDSDGTSIDPNVYTRDIILETNSPIYTGLAGQNIYKSFSAMMDGLVSDNKIVAWQSYAYDWRADVQDIVDNGTKRENGSYTLTETLRGLVDSSKNRKVTIIAHSNGGLIAKALLKKLQDDKTAGRNDLIDHIDVLILVASPQLGTSTAIPALLHGYDTSIMLNILLNPSVARELARNMSSAYGLLPSTEYFNHISNPVVNFVPNSFDPWMTNEITTYGQSVNNYSEVKSFILGSEGRSNPTFFTDTFIPIKGNSSLLNEAESLHNSIDTMTLPTSIRVIQVAGWGLDTVAGFQYNASTTCSSLADNGCTGSYILDQRPIFTIDGDKTVVEPSAMAMNGEKYWVNFKNYNTIFRINRQHKDILEINQLNDFIASTIINGSVSPNSVFKDSKPVDSSNKLRLSVHSPVTLEAYDNEENHTGKVCPPTTDLCYVEENIPNSGYYEFGEGKYLNLTKEDLQKVVLQGTDVGMFTFESQVIEPDGQTITSLFVDIPVTTQTQGEITLNATDTPQLKLDVTGDGVTDFIIAPSSTFDPVTYLQIMKTTVNSLDITQAKKNAFGNRVDNIIKSIQKGKIDKTKLKVDKFKSVLEKKITKPDPKHPKPKKLSKTDAQLLLDMLNQLLDNLG
ncbi:MAG: DUF5018 domain-containing protein [Minisyncoccia bacterium]